MRKETKMIIEAINKVGNRLSEGGKTVVQVEDGFVLIDATDYGNIRYEFVGFIGKPAADENYVPFDGVAETTKDAVTVKNSNGDEILKITKEGVEIRLKKGFGHNDVFSLIKNKVNELLDEDVITIDEGREIVEKYKTILQNDYLDGRFGKRDE